MAGAAREQNARLLLRLLLGTSLTSLGLLPATAQTRSAVQEEVIVNGTRFTADQSSLDKLTRPLLDTPQSVSVINGDLLRERGTTNLNDALRNLPGISLGAGEFSWQGNNPTIRGFLARNDMFLDGMRDFGSYYRDAFDYEQLEVLSGPSSIYFGRGSTGGAINQVSKSPFLRERMTASVGAGTDNTRRATIDYNRPLEEMGPGAAARFNAIAHYANVADRDVGKQRRYGLAPSLALGLGTPTRLTLSYLHESANDIPDYGVPWYFGRPAPVKRSNFYGYDSDWLKTDVNVLTARLEHDLSDNVQLRATARYGQYGRNFRISEGVLAPGTTASVPLANVQVARNMWQGSSKEMMAFGRLETTARFRTFGLEHVTVGGVELTSENSTPLFQNSTGVPTVNLVSPAPHAPFPGTAFSRLYSETPATTTGLYAIDTLTLDPQWELTAGVRWDQFISNYHAITYATVPNTPQAAPTMLNPPLAAQIRNVDAIATYRIGLVYKPAPNGSIYFAHGTSFNPSAESLSQLTSGRALQTQNAFLPPERNQSVEFGTKWQFFDDRMQATAALFRLQKDNARIPSTVPGVNILGGSQQVDGFELSLAGNIAADWRARLGYSYLDSHVTASAPGSSILGAPLVNTPKNAITFWSDYSVTQDWTVGLGGQYVSKRLAQNTAASFLAAPSYMTLDASSQYKFDSHYAIRLNLYNVLDRTYYDQIHPFRAVPGAGRSALLTLEITY